MIIIALGSNQIFCINCGLATSSADYYHYGLIFPSSNYLKVIFFIIAQTISASYFIQLQVLYYLTIITIINILLFKVPKVAPSHFLHIQLRIKLDTYISYAH